MPDIQALVDSLGGMAQKQQLVRRGAGDIDLTRAVRSGSVARARQGWYTTLEPTDQRVKAVRVGGRLTGISAVIQAGGWVLGSFPLHVSVPENAARLRSHRNRRVLFDPAKRDGVILHWDARDLGSRGDSMAVGLADALARVVRDESFETAVAALDWALRTEALDLIDFERLISALPNDYQHIRSWVDPLCDSLPESLSRTRLRLRGHFVVSQVALGDLEHIDLVVDGCVAIETDGEQFHLNRFETDRRKDISITIERYHGLRASARTVFHDWDRFLLAVETALDGRRGPPGSANSGQWSSARIPVPGNAARSRARKRQSPEFANRRGGERAAAGILKRMSGLSQRE
jgi:very-short-patch-repair endonuclease